MLDFGDSARRDAEEVSDLAGGLRPSAFGEGEAAVEAVELGALFVEDALDLIEGDAVEFGVGQGEEFFSGHGVAGGFHTEYEIGLKRDTEAREFFAQGLAGELREVGVLLADGGPKEAVEVPVNLGGDDGGFGCSGGLARHGSVY